MDVEAAMWAAVRALEDRGRLLERMADQFEPRGHTWSARSFRNKARAAREQAQLVREALLSAASTSLAEDEGQVVSAQGAAIRQASGGRAS
jgi:two-component system chemotaxis response regulator CheB